MNNINEILNTIRVNVGNYNLHIEPTNDTNINATKFYMNVCNSFNIFNSYYYTSDLIYGYNFKSILVSIVND